MATIALVLLLASFVALNFVAYRHARAMTRFATGGERTGRPEDLGIAGKLNALFLGVSVPRPENTSTPADHGLSFETLTFSGAHGLRLEAWLIEHPESPGVVALFHGYAGSKDSLLPAAEEFRLLGFTTLLVDFHGSGDSEGDMTSIGWHEAADVAAAVAWTRERFPGQPIHLHGVSLGGVAILRAVGELGIEADRIIVEAPFDRMLTTVERRFEAMGVPSFPSARLLVFWGGVQQGFNGFAHNPLDHARKVSCQTLVLLGAKDPRVRAEDGQRVVENLAGEGRLVVFGNAGHAECRKSDVELWRATVGKLLKGPQPGKP